METEPAEIPLAEYTVMCKTPTCEYTGIEYEITAPAIAPTILCASCDHVITPTSPTLQGDDQQ